MQTWPSTPVPRLAGTPRPLRLFDTTTRRLRPTAPGRTAGMYVCGITPYDATHLGHAATYLAFDLVHRCWLDNGHDVHYVQNVTDVDDPLLERAGRDNQDWVVLAMRETALFREDMAALRVLPPRDYVGAVEAVGEIGAAVDKLLAMGAAYRVADDQYPDIYFDHRTTAEFGYESSYDQPTMRALFAERGGDPDRPGKRHPLDALLWRCARPGEPSWDVGVGPGRPGWHIECAAIALNRLGTSYDVQGGASDLIFPHHEFSAAHAEALTGRHPLARHYCHAGLIGLNGEKMSKSRGNLVFVSELLAAGTDPMAIRLAIISHHYRSDWDWTADLIPAASKRLTVWRAALAATASDGELDSGAGQGGAGQRVLTAMRERLADDLDAPGAIAAVDEWAAAAASAPGSPDGSGTLIRRAVDALLGIAL